MKNKYKWSFSKNLLITYFTIFTLIVLLYALGFMTPYSNLRYMWWMEEIVNGEKVRVAIELYNNMQEYNHNLFWMISTFIIMFVGILIIRAKSSRGWWFGSLTIVIAFTFFVIVNISLLSDLATWTKEYGDFEPENIDGIAPHIKDTSSLTLGYVIHLIGIIYGSIVVIVTIIAFFLNDGIEKTKLSFKTGKVWYKNFKLAMKEKRAEIKKVLNNKSIQRKHRAEKRKEYKSLIKKSKK